MTTSKNSALAKSVNSFARELDQLKSSSMTMGHAQPNQYQASREATGGYRVVGSPSNKQQQQSGNMMQKLMMFVMFIMMIGMGMRLFSKNAPNPVASTSTVEESSQSSNKQPVQNIEPTYLPSPAQTRFEFSQSEQ